MRKSNRRHQYTPEEKVTILKRHLVDHENVSDICDEIGLHPNQFYRWQSELFSDAEVSFQRKNSPKRSNKELKRLEDENARMAKIIDKKDKVIAEITEDYVRLKKNVTDPLMENGLNPIQGIR